MTEYADIAAGDSARRQGYTPTTDEVRESYAFHSRDHSVFLRDMEVFRAEFDRWLAEHDLEVANEVKAYMSKCSCTWEVQQG